MSYANALLQPVQYKVELTSMGVWKTYLSPGGSYYAEFTSHRTIGVLPLLHYTRGRNPETGRRKPAVGFIAIGRIAVGVIAIGQAAVGVITVGQLSIGLVIGVGQLATGLFSLGQVALALIFGLGQFATGLVAVGQFSLGYFAIGQQAFGAHVWSMTRHDSAISRLLYSIWRW